MLQRTFVPVRPLHPRSFREMSNEMPMYMQYSIMALTVIGTIIAMSGNNPLPVYVLVLVTPVIWWYRNTEAMTWISIILLLSGLLMSALGLPFVGIPMVVAGAFAGIGITCEPTGMALLTFLAVALSACVPFKTVFASPSLIIMTVIGVCLTGWYFYLSEKYEYRR